MILVVNHEPYDAGARSMFTAPRGHPFRVVIAIEDFDASEPTSRSEGSVRSELYEFSLGSPAMSRAMAQSQATTSARSVWGNRMLIASGLAGRPEASGGCRWVSQWIRA